MIIVNKTYILLIIVIFFIFFSSVVESANNFIDKAVLIIMSERGDKNREFAFSIAWAVDKWSKEYDIDKYLVLAVLSVESGGFTNKHTAYDDSYGLGQIRPITGRWISKKLGIEFNKDRLIWSVDYNIRMAVWYLAWLKNRFQAVEQVVAAYNQGHNIVKKRLSDGHFLKVVRHKVHVDRVMKKYKEYKYPN